MKALDKNYRTISALAEKYSLPKSFFHRLTSQRLIDYVKAGPGKQSKVLICENVLIEFLEKNRYDSKDQVENKTAVAI